MRGGWLAVGLLCVLAATARGALEQDPEYRFGRGLAELGYYDLALERLLAVRQGLKPESEDYALISLDIIGANTEAARAASAAPEQLGFSGRAIAETEVLLKGKLSEDARNQLNVAQGKALLAQGQLVTEMLVRKPPGVDLDQLRDTGKTSLERAIQVLDAASKGYGEIVKRIESKSNLDDPDRRMRLWCLQQQVVAANETGWTHYRLAEYWRQQGEAAKAKPALESAVTIFTKLGTEHANIAAGISATLGKGRAQQELGQLDKALEAYEAVLAVEPTGAVAAMQQQAYYYKAEALGRLNRFDEALATLGQLQLFSRRFPRAHALDADTVQLAVARTWMTNGEQFEKQAQELAKKNDPRANEMRQQSQARLRQALAEVRLVARPGSSVSREAFSLLGQLKTRLGETAERSAAEWFAEGEGLLQAQQYVESIRAYRSAALAAGVGEEELRQNAWVQMGQAYASAQRYYEAGLALGEAARLFPKAPFAEKAASHAATLLGAVYDRGKRPFEADAYLDAQTFLVENYPSNPAAVRAALRVGDLLRSRRKFVLAARSYANVPKTSPYYERAQYESAESLWSAYLDSAASKPEAALRGQTIQRLSEFIQWSAAEPTATPEQTKERARYRASAKLLLAQVHLDPTALAPDQALATLQDFEKDPADKPHLQPPPDLAPRAWVLRVQAHCAAQRPDAARADLDRVLADKDVPPDQKALAAQIAGSTFVELGEKLAQKPGQEAEARQLKAIGGDYLIRSLDLKPELEFDDYRFIARLLYRAENYGGAADALAKLIRRFERDPGKQQALLVARDEMAQCYMKAGKWREATALFRQLLADRDYGRRMSLHRNLAKSLENLGDPKATDEATGEWRTVERTLKQGTPEWFEARYHLAQDLARLDKKEAAWQLIASTAIAYPSLGGGERAKQFQALFAADLREYKPKLDKLLQQAQPAAPKK